MRNGRTCRNVDREGRFVSNRSALAAVIVVLAAVAAILTGSQTSPAASRQAGWTITDLGALDGTSSSAVGINVHGQIIGTISSLDHVNGRAFLWQRGKMTDLGTLPRMTESEAVAINDHGQVAGTSIRSDSKWLQHAFVWRSGRMTDLGVLRSGLQGDNSSATAINELGAVVGSSSTGGRGYHPFLWRTGRMIDLGTLGVRAPGFAVWPKASAINDRGQVVGTSATASGRVRAYLWEKGRMRELETLGGGDSWGAAINDRGQVVGDYGPDHAYAFLWQHGKMTDLGTLGGRRSHAVAINNRGQIVGWSEVRSGAIHAFLWQNGKLTDLGTPGTAHSWAAAINDRSQVVVNGASCPDATDIVGGYCGATHVGVWERGTLATLPTLGGDAEATAVNERGQVVGVSQTKDDVARAVLWTQGGR